MSDLLIVIGNKRYSTWSLRAWLALKHLGLPFREQRIVLDRPGTAAEILKWSPAGRVPVLVDNGLTVHESIAILEYLNETRADGSLLPKGTGDRALCRSVSAEMHAGFASLRQNLPMMLARKPNPVPLAEQTRYDIRRILTLWEELRERHRSAGPYLFGAFSMADCMYLPVATRFMTYEADLTGYPRARVYTEALLAHPGFQEWKAAALKEEEVRPGDEA
ncbi:MAG: glutathione S-transferase family protein [SAR324 cluster bacterium]